MPTEVLRGLRLVRKGSRRGGYIDSGGFVGGKYGLDRKEDWQLLRISGKIRRKSRLNSALIFEELSKETGCDYKALGLGLREMIKGYVHELRNIDPNKVAQLEAFKRTVVNLSQSPTHYSDLEKGKH